MILRTVTWLTFTPRSAIETLPWSAGGWARTANLVPTPEQQKAIETMKRLCAEWMPLQCGQTDGCWHAHVASGG